MDELELAYSNIVQAESPEAIFGALPGGDGVQRAARLEQVFKALIKCVHPDRHAANPGAAHMAQEATRELLRLHREARARLGAGTYGTAPPEEQAVIPIPPLRAGQHSYQPFAPAMEGDFCQVIPAWEVMPGGHGRRVCVKIPLDHADGDLLHNEAQLLTRIHHKSLPVLLAAVRLDQGQAANILRYIDHARDFIALREHFPQGLPEEHGAWILDRLLSVLGFLHINRVIHGSIEPGNILVTAHNHNAYLIDYTLAIAEASQPGARHKGLNDFSAPELVATKTRPPPHPRQDLYSLGEAMLHLLAEDGDQWQSADHLRLADFLYAMVDPSPAKRLEDAWEAWHQLKRLRQDLFGAASQFLPLHL